MLCFLYQLSDEAAALNKLFDSYSWRKPELWSSLLLLLSAPVLIVVFVFGLTSELIDDIDKFI